MERSADKIIYLPPVGADEDARDFINLYWQSLVASRYPEVEKLGLPFENNTLIFRFAEELKGFLDLPYLQKRAGLLIVGLSIPENEKQFGENKNELGLGINLVKEVKGRIRPNLPVVMLTKEEEAGKWVKTLEIAPEALLAIR